MLSGTVLWRSIAYVMAIGFWVEFGEFDIAIFPILLVLIILTEVKHYDCLKLISLLNLTAADEVSITDGELKRLTKEVEDLHYELNLLRR